MKLRKSALTVVLLAIAAMLIQLPFSSIRLEGQSNLKQPVVSAGTGSLTVTYTAGTVNNGGHAVAIAAGTVSATASQANCAGATYSACNFIYANSSGTVANTTTLSVANAAGNTLLAMAETNGSGVTKLSFPLQNGQLATMGLGALTGALTALTPATAGGTTVGSLALPFSSVYVGAAATNNAQVTGTFTGTRVMTIPDVASDTFTMIGATQTLTNKTLTNPIIATIVNTGNLTLPTSSDTLMGRATTDTMTNKTFNTAGTGNVFQENGSTVSSVAGVLGVVNTFSATSITTGNFTTVGAPVAIPAGLVNTLGKTLRVHVIGLYTNAAASILNSGIALCTVSGCGSGTVVLPAGCSITTANQANNLSNGEWSLDCTLTTGVTGASGTFFAKSVMNANIGATAPVAIASYMDTSTAQSTAVDLTVQEFLQPQFKFSTGNGANTATVVTMTVELLN